MLINHSEQTNGNINDCIIQFTHLILGWKYVVQSRLTKFCFNMSKFWNYHCEYIFWNFLFYYRPYTPNHCICYKTYTYLLSTVHLTTNITRAIKPKTQFSQQNQNADNYSVTTFLSLVALSEFYWSIALVININISGNSYTRFSWKLSNHQNKMSYNWPGMPSVQKTPRFTNRYIRW